jgi:hypothetical protein
MDKEADAPHAGRLKIPTLNLELEQEFMRIEGAVLKPSDGDPAKVGYAGQTVRVRLDEVSNTASHLPGKVEGEDSNGPVCIFDKPFLVMLKLRASDLPYLAIWIGNRELLLEQN